MKRKPKFRAVWDGATWWEKGVVVLIVAVGAGWWAACSAVFLTVCVVLKLALEFALAALATLCFILTANAVGGVQYVAPTEQNIAVLALCLMLLRRFLRFKF